MKIWTLTSSTDDGDETAVFTVEAEAVAALDKILAEDFLRWVSEAPYPGAEIARDALSTTVGYLDSHHLEEHEIDAISIEAAALVAEGMARAASTTSATITRVQHDFGMRIATAIRETRAA
jgi:hypothetical protein